MTTTYDLSRVLLSPDVLFRWERHLETILPELLEAGTVASELPDERIAVLADGSAEIYVAVRCNGQVNRYAMPISAEEWGFDPRVN